MLSLLNVCTFAIGAFFGKTTAVPIERRVVYCCTLVREISERGNFAALRIFLPCVTAISHYVQPSYYTQTPWFSTPPYPPTPCGPPHSCLCLKPALLVQQQQELEEHRRAIRATASSLTGGAYVPSESADLSSTGRESVARTGAESGSETGADDAIAALDAFRAELDAREAGGGRALAGTGDRSWAAWGGETTTVDSSQQRVADEKQVRGLLTVC